PHAGAGQCRQYGDAHLRRPEPVAHRDEISRAGRRRRGSGTPSAPVTTHYVYSLAENHLRFVITPEGDVTEYIYDSGTNGPGLVTSTIAYAANVYTGSSFAIGDLESWAAGISNKNTIQRTQTEYDFRGNVTRVTSWSNLQTSGEFDQTGTSQKTETLYVYDSAGNLLQRAVANPQS